MALVCLLFYLIFAILAVNLFKVRPLQCFPHRARRDTRVWTWPRLAPTAVICRCPSQLFQPLPCPHPTQQGQLFNCIDLSSGNRLDPDYILPPGVRLTKDMCQPGSLIVNASAYYTSRNISMPPYDISTAWVNPNANFDNVAIAMLTLFQVRYSFSQRVCRTFACP